MKAFWKTLKIVRCSPIAAGAMIGLAAGVLFYKKSAIVRSFESGKRPQPTKEQNSRRPVSFQKRAESIYKSGLLSPRAQFELNQTVRQWFASDPVTCAEWLRERKLLGTLNQKFVLDTVFRENKGDMRSACSVLLGLPACDLRYGCIYEALFHGANDPSAVLDMLPQVSWRTRKTLLSDLAVCFGNSNSVQAIIAHQATLGNDCEQLFRGALSAWGKIDPKAAVSFLLSQDPDKLPKSSIDHLTMFLDGLADDNPSGLISIAGMLPKNDGRTRNYLIAASTKLARLDMNAALKWAQGLDGNIDRDQAVSRVVWAFADVDPEQALQLADSLPGFASREEVYKRAAETMFERDKAGSVAWAEKIADPLLRTSASRAVATQWLQTDPQTFTEFVLGGASEVSSGVWRGFLMAHLREKSASGSGKTQLPDWALKLSPESRRALETYLSKP